MKNNEEEIWTLIDTKEIDLGGKHHKHEVRNYYVSNFGRCKVNDKIRVFKEIDENRYYCFAGKRVHVWVATLYIPNPENKLCVDHIYGNKHNNRADNLRWATYAENTNNPITKARYIETINKPEHRQYLSNRVKQQWEDNYDSMVESTHTDKWRASNKEFHKKQEYRDNMSKKLKGRTSPTKGRQRMTYIDKNNKVRYKFE